MILGGVEMEIIIRETEKRDYPGVVEIWNNDIGCNFTVENLSSFHDKLKGNDKAKAFLVELENTIVDIIYIMQCSACVLLKTYINGG